MYDRDSRCWNPDNGNRMQEIVVNSGVIKGCPEFFKAKPMTLGLPAKGKSDPDFLKSIQQI